MTKHGSDYSLGHDERTVAFMEARDPATWAGFVLSHLAPGMSVLDCGCGPGNITMGLAAAVTPGQVTGIDAERSQVETAGERARAAGVANASFQVGDVGELPFDDGSFDVSFTQAVLMHVPDPLGTLREMLRVTRPSGIVAVREPLADESVTLGDAPDPVVFLGFEAFRRVIADRGGDDSRGRDVAALLREAGCDGLTLSVSFEQPASAEDWPRFYAGWGALWDRTAIAQTSVELGYLEPGVPEKLVAAWRTYGKERRGLIAMPWSEVLARPR